MKIAVTTPTGHVGARVTQLLMQAGVRPTLLLRNASRLDPALRSRCDVVEVDSADADGVSRATAGVDALFWVDPPTSDEDPIAGYARMGASAARAVHDNHIPRVVFQSSAGAEARHGFGEIDGLARTEELLDDTGASVTHLRCGFFFTNLLMDLESIRAGVLSTTLPVDLHLPWTDPRDVGDVAAARLLSTAWNGRITQGVHGPTDLSFADVAEIVSAAIGRSVTAQQVTDEDVGSSLRELGMTAAQVEGVVGMARGLRGNFTPENERDVVTTTPTTLAAWAYAVLRPQM